MPITPQGETRPWLFEAFPMLRGRVPWTRLTHAPTPVEHLKNLSRRLERDVWIKRDDLTASLYGGNKPRKLEFILGQALEKKKKQLITLGGLGTNHGLATVIFGKKLEFQTTLGLIKQPITPAVRNQLLAFHAFGANMVYLSSLPKAVRWFYLSARMRRSRAFFIPPGGSNFLGVLGYVDAGLELGMQLKRKDLPLPKAIFLPAGSGGTMAGITLGLRLAGLPIRVIGVQVAPRVAANSYTVRRLAVNALKGLQRLDKNVPPLALSPADFPVDHAHYGAGYGHATEAGRRALDLLAETEGIHLDQTYTGKAFGALLHYLDRESASGPVLFWNTYNSVDLSPAIKGASYLSLPKPFHAFFGKHDFGRS